MRHIIWFTLVAVMVVKPDVNVFHDMINKLSTLESYDGADQGFLVSYFADMNNAPYFNPDIPSEDKMNRLRIHIFLVRCAMNFLISFRRKLIKKFIAKRTKKMQLTCCAIGYSMNHIYYYEKSTWDNGWRQGKFKSLPIPASILTYPITPNLKACKMNEFSYMFSRFIGGVTFGSRFIGFGIQFVCNLVTVGPL